MVIHPAVQSLIDEIDAFRSRTHMSATEFGRASLNDTNFIPNLLRKGRRPSLVTVDKVREFMRRCEEGKAA